MTIEKGNYIITHHAKERIRQRGIKVTQFLKRDLRYSNIRNMITTKEGYQIRYTKNNLKIVLYGNKVITVYQVNSQTIKEDKQRYKF